MDAAGGVAVDITVVVHAFTCISVISIDTVSKTMAFMCSQGTLVDKCNTVTIVVLVESFHTVTLTIIHIATGILRTVNIFTAVWIETMQEISSSVICSWLIARFTNALITVTFFNALLQISESLALK